jgi:hypothetical protein
MVQSSPFALKHAAFQVLFIIDQNTVKYVREGVRLNVCDCKMSLVPRIQSGF